MRRFPQQINQNLIKSKKKELLDIFLYNIYIFLKQKLRTKKEQIIFFMLRREISIHVSVYIYNHAMIFVCFLLL